MTIDILQLQENIDIIYNLREPLTVIDESTNEVFATIIPNKNRNNQNGTTGKKVLDKHE